MIEIQDFCDAMNRLVNKYGAFSDDFAVVKKEEDTGREYVEFTVFVGSWDGEYPLCKMYWDNFEVDINPDKVTVASTSPYKTEPWSLEFIWQDCLPDKYEDLEEYTEKMWNEKYLGAFGAMKQLDEDSPLLETYCKLILEAFYMEYLEKMRNDFDLVYTYYEGIQNIINHHCDIMDDIANMLIDEVYDYEGRKRSKLRME